MALTTYRFNDGTLMHRMLRNLSVLPKDGYSFTQSGHDSMRQTTIYDIRNENNHRVGTLSARDLERGIGELIFESSSRSAPTIKVIIGREVHNYNGIGLKPHPTTRRA